MQQFFYLAVVLQQKHLNGKSSGGWGLEKKTDEAETAPVLLLSQRSIPHTVPCFTVTVRGKLTPGEVKRAPEASVCGQLNIRSLGLTGPKTFKLMEMSE
jgi:hypothetical protein